jgi:hypothetical protein
MAARTSAAAVITGRAAPFAASRNSYLAIAERK